MTYIDGFVVAVPTANKEIYKQHAEAAAIVFKEHGALKLVECWGDDVPEGEVTSFTMAVQCKEDETVCFSWIVWPSRKIRDEGMEKVMEDIKTFLASVFQAARLRYLHFLHIAQNSRAAAVLAENKAT